ncbi:MAG TPA: Rne/Rng family ribonuclease [Myxococcota bacterium]|nr:Rne/Rng family ribonuclease [Myxococcota bacterium]HRY95089.1 Rne/Rng family ribonuclease [Myxococcota bacterium]HSA23049.1 Rne/Rng family ribonuclease [Myxococcota bacterium]
MSTLLAINALHHERRVALVEKGTLAELYIERPSGRGLVGNIYLGRVVRVLPGMDAAFVDIGLDKAGFLYVSDVLQPVSTADLGLVADKEADEEDEVKPPDESAEEGEGPSLPPPARISDLLHNGQEIVVQVAKAPIGTKGARLTTHITLPGRLLVFLPTVDHIGISRRILQEGERRRLKELVEQLRQPKTGFIIRTAAEGADEEVLAADMRFLTRLWQDVQARASASGAPTQLYQDLDLIRRATRDLFTAEVDRLVIDDPAEHRTLLEFVRTFMPALAARVELYEGGEPLFDALGLEVEIGRALDRKVWLKSGGTIVIDQTEALTAIDVNTGRYVGKHNLEDTITKINLEAVREIVCQLRLRDLGGIIIIDFIDMERPANRERVFSTLQEALTADRARTNILKISELGLVEMTRKRVRESLIRSLTEPCPYCDGTGRVKSAASVCYELLRAVEREARGRRGILRVSASPAVAKRLIDEEQAVLESLERRLGVQLRVDAVPHFHLEQYEVRFEP